MTTNKRILVLGDDTRSFLATVRSLGRNGLEVHAAPFNYRSPSLASRYIHICHWLPYYMGDGRDWLRELDRLIQTYDYDLLIPCDERTLLPLHWHRHHLCKTTRLAIPDELNIDLLFDKYKTRELAKSLAIPVATGRMIESTDTSDTIHAETGFPVAIKPASSYSPERLYARNKVYIAYNQSDLNAALEKTKDQSRYFEAFFSGYGLGISILASSGRIIQAFEHHRVHEHEGAGYYRVSADLSPQLLDAAQKFIEGCKYTGIAMIEFKRNPQSGEWILLEINARPWGSLPLPVGIGVDFPYLWYKLLVNKETQPPIEYKTGIYARNIFLDSYYIRAKSKEILHTHPPSLPRYIITTIKEYSRVFINKEIHDVYTRDDIKPALIEYGEYARSSLKRLVPAKDLFLKWFDQVLFRRAVKHGISDISIVCQGNICRSPFAAEMLRKVLVSETTSHININSYGNMPIEHRGTPTNGILAALKYDIDLSNHRSRHFVREAAMQTNLVIVFDEINYKSVVNRYPDIKAPVVMLGSFSLNNGRYISDPDGGDLQLFKATYQKIFDATNTIGRILTTLISHA